jgi:phosphoglucomutase/phosphomannomutase
MSLLEQAIAGIQSIDVDAAYRDAAVKNLRRWLEGPEFAPYRPQIEWLIRERKWAGLLDRFYQILPFGTGGRRGAVGVGPNRMNPWTLAASVQGHCEYLAQQFPDSRGLKVVVAYDVRQFEDKNRNYNPDLPNPVLHLSSKMFAQQAARVYSANGITTYLLPDASTRYMATPELSFAIRQLGAHGGLNVSASHNPPDDNGGKFYDERGGQPVPPDDQIMADLVDQVVLIKDVSWADAVRSGKIQFLEESTHKAYIELCRKQSLVKPPRFDEIQVVYTPLHGVGSYTAMETLAQQGFRIRPVEEQMTPDGQFPNVTKSPNPEVSECLDRAEALAKSLEADLVLATDPDADRLGGMAPDAAGKFHVLDGNTICALVTNFKLSKLVETGTMPQRPVVLTTLVTTSLVTKIARHYGSQVVNNLRVGFKFMADVVRHLEDDGVYEDVQATPADMVLACEESHGIMAMPQIRDKDAAAACLLLAELALDQKRQGRTVIDYLAAMHRKFGHHRCELRNIIMPGVEGKQNMARMLDRLRQNPPTTLGAETVKEFVDLWDESGWLGAFKGTTDRQSRNFLIFRFGDSASVALRPSGTEPKAKAYVETCSLPKPAGMSDDDWKKRCTEVDARCRAIADAFVALCTS